MCAKGTEINVTGAGLGIRPSGAAALFELLAAAAGAWLVPPDLLPGDRRHRWFTQYASQDRKSTRLNSSHRCSSYAVFCLKKPKASRSRSALQVVAICQSPLESRKSSLLFFFMAKPPP